MYFVMTLICWYIPNNVWISVISIITVSDDSWNSYLGLKQNQMWDEHSLFWTWITTWIIWSLELHELWIPIHSICWCRLDHTQPNKTRPYWIESDWIGIEQGCGMKHIGSNQTEPNYAKLNQTTPVKTISGQTWFVQTELNQVVDRTRSNWIRLG